MKDIMISSVLSIIVVFGLSSFVLAHAKRTLKELTTNVLGSFWAEAKSSYTYSVYFYIGKYMMVTVGEVDTTNLDIEVYDPNGTLIRTAEGHPDRSVEFRVDAEGVYTIKVVNRDRVGHQYKLKIEEF